MEVLVNDTEYADTARITVPIYDTRTIALDPMVITGDYYIPTYSTSASYTFDMQRSRHNAFVSAIKDEFGDLYDCEIHSDARNMSVREMIERIIEFYDILEEQ